MRLSTCKTNLEIIKYEENTDLYTHKPKKKKGKS